MTTALASSMATVPRKSANGILMPILAIRYIILARHSKIKTGKIIHIWKILWIIPVVTRIMSVVPNIAGIMILILKNIPATQTVVQKRILMLAPEPAMNLPKAAMNSYGQKAEAARIYSLIPVLKKRLHGRNQ